MKSLWKVLQSTQGVPLLQECNMWLSYYQELIVPLGSRVS